MVDTKFFRRPTFHAPTRPTICSAGLEFRDYPTMVDAVRGLDAACGPRRRQPVVERRKDSSAEVALPDNVEIRRLPLDELRQLYAESDVVVVPLVETDFQAGITTILEAMAMGKPIVCSLTSGQDDTIVDGETGLYVPPGDAGAMRAAIDRLLGDPELAATDRGRRPPLVRRARRHRRLLQPAGERGGPCAGARRLTRPLQPELSAPNGAGGTMKQTECRGCGQRPVIWS